MESKYFRLLFFISHLFFVCDAYGNTKPITVFTAKQIYTMNPMLPEATAVAVQDGKVLSVGDVASFQSWLKGKSYKVDDRFKDKIITPGFIEPHAHGILAGMLFRLPSLSTFPIPRLDDKKTQAVKNKQAAMLRLKQYAAALKSKTEPLIVTGYDVLALDDGKFLLDKQVLDKISNTHPIVVMDASFHNTFVNSAVLDKYHITAAEAKISGVQLGKDGKPNGIFNGVIASAVIIDKVFSDIVDADDARKSLRYITKLSRKYGITTTSELAMGIVNWDKELSANKQFYDSDQTPMRAVVVSFSGSLIKKYGANALNELNRLQAQSNDKLIFNGVKFFSDDAFLSLTMKMKPPGYFDGHQGRYLTPPQKLANLMLPWWKAGNHIHIHSNGDGGNQSTLDALQKLQDIKPRFDHRFTFEHLGSVSYEMIRKMSKLGAIASLNPYYLYLRSELNQPYIGSDRAYSTLPLESLIENGVPVSLHSDMPVSPPLPLEKVWIAVNRLGLSGKVRGAPEKVNVHQAMKMITIDAAYTLGVEDKIGSIEAGKFADFTILDSDPFKVNKKDIRDIHVWGTVFSGTVYPASEIH